MTNATAMWSAGVIFILLVWRIYIEFLNKLPCDEGLSVGRRREGNSFWLLDIDVVYMDQFSLFSVSVVLLLVGGDCE
jgi:hypothetical protein